MIRLEDVSKSYDGKQAVVDRLHLHVRTGEVLILLGASGCGKTTTLKMINRLIEPTTGHICIEGRDNARIDPVTLRRSIGYVFQMIGLFPHMTVAENIGTVPRLLRWPAGRVSSRVAELMELVGLQWDECAHRYPRALSGGQRQRVGFARALAGEPKLMLLDEPFGALDPITRDSLQAEFRRIQRKPALTAVLVTHDIAEALLLADRVAVMRNGRIIRLGTPSELMIDPRDDYVATLFAMPKRHADRIEAIAAQREGTAA